MSTFNKNQDRLIINHQIRAFKVICIDKDNLNLGLMPLAQALLLAKENGLDLVQVSGSKDNPTCKILDSGKYKYELSKKKKEADKHQREAIVKLKEIKFRPSTDVNDLRTKAKKAEQFIQEGCKVKVSITFKGREISHQEVALKTLEEFISFIPGVQMVGKPSFDKRDLSVFLAKKEALSVKEAS